MRHFATLVFFGLQFLEKTRVLTQAERQRLGKMLTDVEAIGLAGRVVLLLADEGNDFQNTELVDQALEDLSELKAILDPSVSIAADPFRDMRAEWVTVANHLASLAGGGMLNRKDKDKDPIRCWLGMWDTWVQFGKLLGNGDDTPHSCAYPRCWRPPTPWKDVKTDYKCGRCTMVSYCGPDCQRAHWQLATSESHRLQCNPSGLPLAE
ncbi:hypothetical protein FS749_012403 [Ceratobasidium sp. UAMH 11750]|nr:hypothetical protein FS749_012403 [Ceratobasidium sp. UAMH 11750]